MALRNPYDYYGGSEKYPNGELLVTPEPEGTNPRGASTFYFARRFTFAEGTYTFRITADDAATVWLGPNQLESRIVATPTLDVPSKFDMYIPAGEYRMDVILRNLPSEATPCYFSMYITQGDKVIYSSTKEGWLLDDSPISDDDLLPAVDPRSLMPVWSILPNWKDGITERLVWLTDVMSSERAAEQRRSVRLNARRYFEVSFMRQRAKRNRLDNFFVGVGSAQFMLPLFHEQVKMLDGIDLEATGVEFPDGSLYMREFRTGDYVLVSGGDPDDYDIMEVGDVEQMRFSWAKPPLRPWPKGTRIFPMRIARIASQAPQASNHTDTVGTAQVLFDIDEVYEVPASWGASANSEPYFRFIPHREDTIDVDYSRKSFTLDNQSGRPAMIDHGRYTSSVIQTKLRLFGRTAAYGLRQFLQAARGMAQHFYCSTFMNDVEPVGDIPGGDTLVVQPMGFARYMAQPQAVRLLLGFQFYEGGQIIYRTVKSAQELRPNLTSPVTAEQLTLDSPLPAIKLSTLKRISFVSLTRFDQDQFEIFHPTNGQVAIDVSLVLRQFGNARTTPE